MDDTQRIVKCGNLSLHVPGGFFKKRWHARYLVLYDGSKSGVRRLELFESEIKFKKQDPAKIIPLVDCVRVVTCQRQKTTYTFEVRTSDQFYLLAAQSFQDMTDWVNCLRLVAFGPNQATGGAQQSAVVAARQQRPPPSGAASKPAFGSASNSKQVDVLLEPPPPPVDTHPALAKTAPSANQPTATTTTTTASQAAALAASALAKTRQRQPSLLGSCKPQPPTDSPFIRPSPTAASDTLTPTVRGQLIAAATAATAAATTGGRLLNAQVMRPAALDEEEENLLYCSIEDNPSEHNYRVKVVETELALRCQLKCYQLTAPTAVSQQYAELGQQQHKTMADVVGVTFYQLIVGPQALTLLNDYQALRLQQAGGLQQHQGGQPQGLWSWPYQCIRRYGFDKDNCFMFEAGRKCGSGPGQFVVQTPKAHTIYQDVVRFVNELRSLNPSQTNASQAPSNDQAAVPADAPAAQVTQIPVTWAGAPSSPVGVAVAASADPKRQFFDALRQTAAAAGQMAEQQQPAKVSVAPSVASEETDESGYEQGDESVDSASKSSPGHRARLPGVGSRKRTQQQQVAVDSSMSSASSTSSSGAGSPGHSVSRQTGPKMMAGATGQQAPPGKGKLGTMLNELASDQPEDFEANLIRDVYSEITKLHAKFAVATSTAGSAEDSMSSHSSQQEEEASEEEEEREEEEREKRKREPMYSNLARPAGATNQQRQLGASSNRQLQDRRMQQPSQHQHQGNNSHHQLPEQLEPYLSRPIYPTMLNPIPECGEPGAANGSNSSNNGQIKPTRTSYRTGTNEYRRAFAGPQSNNNNNRGPQSTITNNNKPTNEMANMNRRPPSTGLLKSKLPTNHYVINDVQYAKISRNLYSKYESCL